MQDSMNPKPISPAQLVKALADKFRSLLGQVDWLRAWSVEELQTNSKPGNRFDLRVKLPLQSRHEVDLWVQCKSNPKPSLFPYIYAPSEKNPRPVRVFAAPFISQRMAEVCQENGWSWFDLAGNCWLDIPGLLRLQHSGKPSVLRSPKPTANLSTPEAGRVIRALLLPDNAGRRWTQRELQNHCQPNVSLGLVNKVVRHLREQAFVETSGDGFLLREPLKLLLAWRDVYRFDRHDRRSYFTLMQGKKLRDTLTILGSQTGGFAVYASFSAADFQAPHVRQPKTWLYVRQQEICKFEEMVEAKPVDSGENIVLLIPDDDGVFYLGDGGMVGQKRMSHTNIVQTYVDLWHSGGRGHEAADALLEQKLKSEWKARGMQL